MMVLSDLTLFERDVVESAVLLAMLPKVDGKPDGKRGAILLKLLDFHVGLVLSARANAEGLTVEEYCGRGHQKECEIK
ncbi:MAG: hypothetical protein H0V18_12555 [Pyrinomonadaceae bacterium]|nr:hypothetical protein [Pyrinomonadaceae bacterium]